jgi:hypothetical protein
MASAGPEELIRRLQSAATLAIHLRAAEPDWSVARLAARTARKMVGK